MSASDSDSENDFASADEGDFETTTIVSSAANNSAKNEIDRENVQLSQNKDEINAEKKKAELDAEEKGKQIKENNKIAEKCRNDVDPKSIKSEADGNEIETTEKTDQMIKSDESQKMDLKCEREIIEIAEREKGGGAKSDSPNIAKTPRLSKDEQNSAMKKIDEETKSGFLSHDEKDLKFPEKEELGKEIDQFYGKEIKTKMKSDEKEMKKASLTSSIVPPKQLNVVKTTTAAVEGRNQMKETIVCGSSVAGASAGAVSNTSGNTKPNSQRKILHIEKKLLFSDNLNKHNLMDHQSQTPQQLQQMSSQQMTEKETAVMDRLCAAKDEKKISPSGWGLGWSSSFISSAANSVSTFTSHVTQGFETVLETVEATLGAPPPEELASAASNPLSSSANNWTNKKEGEIEVKKENSPAKNDSRDASTPKSEENAEGVLLPGGLLGGLTGLTRVIESTGSKVLTGGLDTLELIGKKTMDILTEGDPGLRTKRNIFGNSEVTLSQMLRETRNKLDESLNNCDDAAFSEKDLFPVHYSKLFDESRGLVHLEALEMLSDQSKDKLEDLLHSREEQNDDSRKMETMMKRLETLCQDLPPTDDTPDEETFQDFSSLVTRHIASLSFHLSIDKIKLLQNEAKQWIQKCKDEQDKGEAKDAQVIYTKGVTVLAEMTARTMELFHKLAEIVSVSNCQLEEIYDYAKHLTGLTSVLCTEIGILTSQFCQCLSTAADDSEDPDSINPLITNVFLEASNSNTYIQDAFRLLIPILQLIAYKHL